MKKKFLLLIPMAALFFSQSVTVFAVTESEVEAVGKETAAGNVFIWFLCAIAFLKISQKIDSFLSSLGTNVGYRRLHDGGADDCRQGAYHMSNPVTGGSFFKGGSPRFDGTTNNTSASFLSGRPGRGCGKAVYPERHAHHDRAGNATRSAAGLLNLR